MRYHDAMVLIGAVSCACAGKTQTAASAETDGAAAQEARSQVEGTMRAFASMDLEAFKAGLTEDVTAFEMDLESKPVRLGSRDDVVRYAEGMFAELKKMGAKLQLDFHASACDVTGIASHCIVEFDFKATMPDGSTMVQPSRNTVALRKGASGWKWTHWHSSLAVAPAPAAQHPAP